MHHTTHTDLWSAIDTARALLEKTNDRLLRSSIPILAAALTREDPVALHRAEQTALEYVRTMAEAHTVLFGFDETLE